MARFPNATAGKLELASAVMQWPYNAINPNTQPLSYERGKARFAITPTDANGIGWGRPFFDENNKPIKDGTYGGSNITKAVFKRKDKWVSHHSGGWHKFGEIDWRGKDPDGNRIVLSYHGTSGRHIYDGFKYGSDPKHNYIYFQGNILGVAPLPVMGASLYKTSLDKYVIIAVCLMEGRTEVLYRLVGSPMKPAYVEANLDSVSARYSDNNPYGWKSAGTAEFVTEGELLAPSTPFFAAESGIDFAQCRRIRLTYNNGLNDVEEIGTVRLRMKLISVTVDNVTEIRIGAVTVTGEQSKLSMIAFANKTSDPAVYSTSAYSVYVTGEGTPTKLTPAQVESVAANCAPPWSVREIPDGVIGHYFGSYNNYAVESPVHHWVCSDIQVNREIKGKLNFGVDYVGNELIDIMYQVDAHAFYVSQWGMGVDGTQYGSGSYIGQELILKGEVAWVLGDGTPSVWFGLGISNSTPIVYQYAGINALVPVESLSFEQIFKFSCQPRSDLAHNIGTVITGKGTNFELAYNTGNYSAKQNVVTSPYAFEIGDGTTKQGVSHIVQNKLTYTLNTIDHEVEVTTHVPMTEAWYDENGYQQNEGFLDAFLVRQSGVLFLDVRNGAPISVTKKTVHDYDGINTNYPNATYDDFRVSLGGERRRRLEVTRVGQKDARISLQDPEDLTDEIAGRFTNGWTFYPQNEHTEPMAATVWAGEPAGGVQPPMSVTEAFSLSTQPREYGTDPFVPLFGTMDDMKLDRWTAYVHHTAACRIEESNAGYLGWYDYLYGDTSPYIPAALQQPLQHTNFEWQVKYKTVEAKWPNQKEDTTKEYQPRLESFVKDSPIFTFDSTTDKKMDLHTISMIHDEYAKGSIKVSAAVADDHYIINIAYSTTDGEVRYYSYFSATDSALTDISPVGTNFAPVGVI